MELGTVIQNIYEEDPEYISITWNTLWEFSEISIPSREISIFSYIKKNKYRLHFGKKFLTLFLAFKDCFNKHGLNFDDVSKNSYSRSSFNKDNSKQRLWRHNLCLWRHQSSYIVYVVMWPKFVNSSISMTDITITSVL